MSAKPRQVRIELSLKTLVLLILVIASLWLLVMLWPVLLVLAVALLIVGTLSPAVSWLEKKRIKRGLGITIVFLTSLIVAIFFFIITIPTFFVQAGALLDSEPALRAKLANYLVGSRLGTPLAVWLRGLTPDALTGAIGQTVVAFAYRFFGAVAYGLSALFLGLYIMADRDRLRGWLFAITPRAHHLQLSRVMMNLETIVGAYIRGQVFTSMLMGVFAFLLLTACGVENALALAAIAGLADVLPYIGPIISVGPMVIASLSHGPLITLIILITMIVYEEFESRVLIPRIYGRVLRLPSSLVLFALLTGGTLMGILGALLALPAAAIITMLIEEFREELPGEQEQAVDRRRRAADNLAEKEYELRAAGEDSVHSAEIASEISQSRRVAERNSSRKVVHPAKRDDIIES